MALRFISCKNYKKWWKPQHSSQIPISIITLYTYEIPPAVSFEVLTSPPKELLMQLLKEWMTDSFTEADVFCGAFFFLTRKQSTVTWEPSG